MKLFDQKGRLFGKLNVIDAVALLIVLGVLVAAVAKIVSDRNSDPLNSSVQLEYVVRVNGLDSAVYNELTRYVDYDKGVRDQLMASGDLLPGHVVDVWAVPHVVYADDVDAAGAPIIFTEEGADARLDVFFKIQAAVVNPVVNEVGTQEVRTGKQHIVKTAHFEFTYGTVRSCRWTEGADTW